MGAIVKLNVMISNMMKGPRNERGEGVFLGIELCLRMTEVV